MVWPNRYPCAIPERRLRPLAAGWLAVGVCALLLGAGVFAQEGPQQWRLSESLAMGDFRAKRASVVRRHGERIWVGTEIGLAWTESDGRMWNWVDLSRAGYVETPTRLTDDDGRLPTGSARAQRRNTVTGIALDGDTIWAGTLNGVCVSRDRGRSWATYGRPHGLGAAAATAVGARGGLVVVATVEGLFISRDDGESWEKIESRLAVGPRREGIPPGVRYVEVGQGRRGLAVWLAGYEARGGPALIRSEDSGSTWEAVNPRPAGQAGRNPPEYAHSVHIVGAEVWACTRLGLARSRDFGDTWRVFDTQRGLSGEEAFDLSRRNGRIWVAAADGVWHADSEAREWEKVRGYHAPATSLAVGRNALWLATEGGLLKRAHGGAWETFAQRREILALAVASVGAANVWWAGTRGGLCVSRDKGYSWRTYTVSDGMPGNVVRALAADGRGGVWAATDGGVARLSRDEQLRVYTKNDGLRSNRIHDIDVDGDSVWAATDRGIARFDHQRSVWRIHHPDIRWLRIAAASPYVYATTTEWPEKRPGQTAPPSRLAPRRPGETFLVRGEPDYPAGERWRHLALPEHDGGPMNDVQASEHVAWVATSQGLFRSRDSGATWARFERETLWGNVALQAFPLEHSEWGVFSYPGDFSPLFGGLSFTLDFGRRWRSLADRPVGEVTAVRAAGDDLLCGARNGLWVREGFRADLRSGRPGWLGWLRLAYMNRADSRPDHLGYTAEIDRHGLHGLSLWLGSIGGGLLEVGFPAHDRDTPFGRGRPASWHPHRQTERGRPADQLSGNDVMAICAGPERLWVGTNLGLSAYDRSGAWRSWYPEEGGLAEAPVTAVSVCEGEVWVGSRQGMSVYRPATGEWRRPDLPGEWPSQNIRAIRSIYGQLWVGTDKGLCLLDDNGNWSFPLKDIQVYDIQLGAARAYVGTDRGLYGLDHGGKIREHRMQRNSALASDTVYRVLPVARDVWALTEAGITLVLRDREDAPETSPVAPSKRGPEGVVVVANSNDPDSVELARRYVAARGVPAANVCELPCPTGEAVSREDFESAIRNPLRRFLAENGLSRRVSFIVLMRGMPLIILPSSPTGDEMASDAASVDSELTLHARPHVERGPLANPYLNRDEPFDSTRFGMYLVTRLDGPSLGDAVNQAVAPPLVEANRSFGSRGFAYFDLDPERGNAGGRVNDAITANYRLMLREGRFKDRLRVNREPRVFDLPNECPAAFFYLGWHSNIYRPRTFTWLDGAVGMHVHALSARTLRDAEGSWLAGALGDGLTAGIGTVRQPGILGVDTFENLYRHLHSGYTWGESAYMSTRYLSWQTVVVGDPLYTPFP